MTRKVGVYASSLYLTLMIASRRDRSGRTWNDESHQLRPQTWVSLVPFLICRDANRGLSQQVKRVVITASCASILEVRPEPTTFSEKDWNEESWRIIEEKGRESEGVHKYRASKTLAEKGMVLTRLMARLDLTASTAAWKLWESNRSTVGWDLTTIHPSFVSDLSPIVIMGR
jgi:hypothetical protein